MRGKIGRNVGGTARGCRMISTPDGMPKPEFGSFARDQKLTREEEDMLKRGRDGPPLPQVQQEAQRVDVRGPADGDGQLGASESRTMHFRSQNETVPSL